MKKERAKVRPNGQWELVEKEEIEFKPEDAVTPKTSFVPPNRKPLPPGSNIKPLNVKHSPSEELVEKMDRLETELKELKKEDAGKHYKMGHTKSGKPIMSTDGDKPYHSDFNAADHRDAYFVHGRKAMHLKEAYHSELYHDMITHHEGMAKKHWDAYQNMLTQRPKAVDAHGLKKSLPFEEHLFEDLSKTEVEEHFDLMKSMLVEYPEDFRMALSMEVIDRNKDRW